MDDYNKSALVKTLDQNLKNGKLELAVQLIQDNKSDEQIKFNCADIITNVAQHITEVNFKDKPELFAACEQIFKIIGEKGPKEDALFQFLELLEETKEDEVFTSYLKALQIVLLRINHTKSQAIGWVLDAISSYINSVIQLPNSLTEKMGAEEELLLEHDPIIKRLLSLYLNLFLFIEPIQDCLLKQLLNIKSNIFLDSSFNSRNVLSTFLIQQMGGNFAYLDHSMHSDTETYSRQCARTLTELLIKNISDPFMLFHKIEERLSLSHVNEPKSDIFLHKDRVTDISLAMLFYFIFVEKFQFTSLIPNVYRPQYLIDKGILTSIFLIQAKQSSLQYKGIRLASELLNLVSDQTLVEVDIDNETKNNFYEHLNKVIIYSSIERNRKSGVDLFKKYVMKHTIEMQYKIMLFLFNTLQHDSLMSFTGMIYKNLILGLINDGNIFDAKKFSCKHFQNTMMMYICKLSRKEQTDLMDNRELIMFALNFLIYLMVRDKDNVTGIWDIITEIQCNFIEPLNKALDLSKAHYKNELKLVVEGLDKVEEDIMDLEIQNDDAPNMALTKEKKTEIITYALNNFDIMSCLLARVNECVALKDKK